MYLLYTKRNRRSPRYHIETTSNVLVNLLYDLETNYNINDYYEVIIKDGNGEIVEYIKKEGVLYGND